MMLLLVDTAAASLGLYKSNIRKKTKLFNSGGYFLQDASNGRTTGEFYRAGEDDGLVTSLMCKYYQYVS